MTISPSESATRAQFIDIALEKAGWKLNDPYQVGQEIPVDGFDAAEWKNLQRQIRRMSDEQGIYVTLPVGISDYVLYRENGEVLAVVEAKKTIVDARIAEAQAAFYVKEFEKRQTFRPFAFLTNGKEIYFWDVGLSERRQVHGFFTGTDLERLLFIRQHQTPLAATPINTEITNRGYQIEAVRRISESFERGRRKALIVMATGTGKTRVAAIGMRRTGKPHAFTDEDIERYKEAWSQPGAITAMLNWYRAAARYGLEITNGMRVSVPTLILWGAQDFALSRRMARPSLDYCDDGNLIFFPDATHWVQHEEADEVNRQLLTFVFS